MKRNVKRKIYQYTVFFELNENGGYAVSVPALLGLVTEGDSLGNARLMAKDAIRCYIEGLMKTKEKIPLEKEMVQLRLTVQV